MSFLFGRRGPAELTLAELDTAIQAPDGLKQFSADQLNAVKKKIPASKEGSMDILVSKSIGINDYKKYKAAIPALPAIESGIDKAVLSVRFPIALSIVGALDGKIAGAKAAIVAAFGKTDTADRIPPLELLLTRAGRIINFYRLQEVDKTITAKEAETVDEKEDDSARLLAEKQEEDRKSAAAAKAATEAQQRVLKEREAQRVAEEERVRREKAAADAAESERRRVAEQERLRALDTTQEQRIARLQGEVEDLDNENKALVDDLETTRTELAASKRTIETQKTALADRRLQKGASSQELEKLRKEMADKEARFKAESDRHEVELRTLEQSFRDNEDIINRARGTAAADVQAHAALEETNRTITVNLQRVQSELEAARTAREAIEAADRAALADRERQIADQDVRIRDLADQLARVQRDAGAAETNINVATSTLSDREATIARQRTELADLNTRHDTTERALQAAHESQARFEQERINLTAAAQRAREAADRARAELLAEQREVERLRTEQLEATRRALELDRGRQEAQALADAARVRQREAEAGLRNLDIQEQVARVITNRDAEADALEASPEAASYLAHIQAMRVPAKLATAPKANIAIGIRSEDGTPLRVYTTKAVVRTVGEDADARVVFWDQRQGLPTTVETNGVPISRLVGQPDIGNNARIRIADARTERVIDFEPIDTVRGYRDVVLSAGRLRDAAFGAPPTHHLVLYFYTASPDAVTRRIRRMLVYSGRSLGPLITEAAQEEEEAVAAEEVGPAPAPPIVRRVEPEPAPAPALVPPPVAVPAVPAVPAVVPADSSDDESASDSDSDADA